MENSEKYEKAIKEAKILFKRINGAKNNPENNRTNIHAIMSEFPISTNKEKQEIYQLIIDNFDIFYDQYLEEIKMKTGQTLLDTIKRVEKKLPRAMLEDFRRERQEEIGTVKSTEEQLPKEEKKERELAPDVLIMYNGKIGKQGPSKSKWKER